LDGLGIARGAWGRPYIFEEIKEILKKSDPVKYAFGVPASQEFNRVKKIMLKHAALIYEDKGETGKFEMRKHLAWYIKGFPGASLLRRKLVMAENLKEIKQILKEVS
jgi:tRNA-dihydrouridine synthase